MVLKGNKASVIILGWIIANLLGVALSGALILIFPFLTSIRGMLISSLIIGLPIGFAQWVVLRRVAPISTLWALTISTGLLLGLVVTPFIARQFWGFLDDESVLSLMASFATIGVCVGLVQWLFIRIHFTKSLIWLLSSGGGLGLGFGLVLVSNLINQNGIASIFLVVLVYATVTGFVMSWLRASQGKTRSDQANAI